MLTERNEARVARAEAAEVLESLAGFGALEEGVKIGEVAEGDGDVLMDGA